MKIGGDTVRAGKAELKPKTAAAREDSAGNGRNAGVFLEELTPSGRERRDFLQSGLALMGACGLGALAVPFIGQMRPDGSRAAAAALEVDIGAVKAGEQIVVSWRGQPVVIRNRLPEEIAAAKAIPVQSLADKRARNANLPADSLADDNARSGGKIHENWLIFINLCTHLGCPTQRATERQSREIAHMMSGGETEFRAGAGGWFCPCHGSLYDMSARVIKGPANRNMAIPPYRFLSDTVLQIG